MLDILLIASVSFIITFLAIPIVIQVAQTKKLYDVPDSRKIHTGLVPSLGGIAIFGGFIFTSLLFISSFENPEFQYFFASAVIIFFLGLKDDLILLSATKKFIGQFVAASILIHLGGIKIDSMHGLFGMQEIPEAFSLAISYLTVIVVINSFNLIDGVDGLAGTLGLMTMMVFGIYFFANDFLAYSLLAFCMAGSLVAFLIFNHHPAKIFMGDSGSLILGLVNSIMVLKFISVANTGNVDFRVDSAVAVGFSILMVPLFDTLRVFTIRIFNGRSPFSPDRNHVHHLLLDLGFSPSVVTILCVGINLMFIAMAFYGSYIGPTYIIIAMLVIAFSGIGILYYRKSRLAVMAENALNDKYKIETKTESRVVTFTKDVSVAEKN
jgi:UDP-GlcNAc:undecaprenyl-phosphate/decaprenyl-phosphate GlcNAc-1-phosphate transferase